jgi:hypothetical protein
VAIPAARNGAGRRCADAASHYCNGFTNARPQKALPWWKTGLTTNKNISDILNQHILPSAAQAAVKR